jgi:hypothetical protein
LKSDNNSEDEVTSWAVESKYSDQEFKGYNPALSMFNKISKEGTPVILYEIKRNRSDGSTVKKIPLLNSKKFKTKSTLFRKIIQNKSKENSDHHSKKKKGLNAYRRIFLLIGVFLTFVTIIFIMNSIGGR